MKEEQIKNYSLGKLERKEIEEYLDGEQLSKAKALLEMVLDWQGRCGNGHPTWQEVCVKIKQFLKEDWNDD